MLGFGVTRMLEAALGGTILVGQPEFMAPEQITGFAMEVGPAADQYALGLVIYQALTSSRPFRGDSVGATLLQVVRSVPEPLRALRPDIPAHVEAAVMRALSRDRHARFPSLPAFVAALQGGDALPPGLLELTDPWLRPSPRADAAQQRALAVSGAAPSFQSVALGLTNANSGVPEIVEDSATVPNTMEEVMRLAVPPERIEVLESTAPVDAAQGARPGVARVRPLPGMAKQAVRALAMSDKAMSDKALATGQPPAEITAPDPVPKVLSDEIHLVEINSDPGSPIAVRTEAAKDATPRAPAAFSPPAAAVTGPPASSLHNVMWALIGILLGVLLGYFLHR